MAYFKTSKRQDCYTGIRGIEKVPRVPSYGMGFHRMNKLEFTLDY